MWYKTSVFTTWKQARKAIGPTFNHNWMCLVVYSPFPSNLITSIRYPCILPFEILVACIMPSGMRFTKVPILTKVLLMGI